MKKIYLFAIFTIALLTGCSEAVSDPVFADDEFYIHAVWSEKASVNVGDPLVRTIYVSPADGSVKCTWTLDGKVVSNDVKVVWYFNQPGTYDITFAAERNGVVKTRTGTVTVSAGK